MNSKILAIVGIVSYVLEVIVSAQDDQGNSKAPDAAILVSGTANLIFVVVAAVVLWRNGARRTALALPIVTLVSTGASLFLTPTISSVNLIVNALQISASLLYIYTLYLLFTFKQERQAA